MSGKKLSILKNSVKRNVRTRINSVKKSIRGTNKEGTQSEEMKFRETLSKIQKRERIKGYENDISKGIIILKKNEEKYDLDPYDNKMISMLIDLCFGGDTRNCYNIHMLILNLCRKNSENSNVHNTVKTLAYKLGLTEDEIETCGQQELCDRIIHSNDSPGLFGHTISYLESVFYSLFTWSTRGIVTRLKKVMLREIFEKCPVIYNSVFPTRTNIDNFTKSIWLINAKVELSVLNTFIDTVKVYADLGKPSFLNEILQLKIPRTELSFGILTKAEQEELKKLYNILIFVREKVFRYIEELNSDKEILKMERHHRKSFFNTQIKTDVPKKTGVLTKIKTIFGTVLIINSITLSVFD